MGPTMTAWLAALTRSSIPAVRRRLRRPAAIVRPAALSCGPALGILLALTNPVLAASFALSEQQQSEAVRVGAESTTAEDISSEWTITGEVGEVRVMTPFHRLALAARRAAFRGRSLEPSDVQRVLKQDRERLVLWAALRGASADFARFYQPVFLVASEPVKPAWVQNEQTAARQPDGTYLARCVYTFPTAHLTPTTRGTLSVRGQDGREVAAFSLDLSAMR
jgi:hypothetical protein